MNNNANLHLLFRRVLFAAALPGLFLGFPGSSLAQEPVMVFRSGYEPNSTPNNTVALTTLAGTDQYTGFDWNLDLNEHPDIGFWRIEYTGGTNAQRWARIIEEPGNPGNHVLWFNIIHPNASNGNGRVQTDMYGNGPIRDFTLKNRLFLHPDLQALVDHNDRFTFFTLFELWNNPNWILDPYPFRIALNLTKEAGAEQPLRFSIKGQQDMSVSGSQWVTLWEQVSTKSIPLGTWLDLEIRVKEGDDFNGRFFMALKVDGGEREVLFDLTTLTHNPNDPAPSGFTHINTQKLYTNTTIVNRVRNAGGSVQVYWDDFEFVIHESSLNPVPIDPDLTVVTTSDGRGADTRVANAGINRENFNAGAEQFLPIRTAAGPGSVSVGYVRFDLENIEKPFSDASLKLTSFGNPPSTPSALRLYGLVDGYTGSGSKLGENWTEGTKSFSLASTGEITGANAPGFIPATSLFDDAMVDLGAIVFSGNETPGIIAFSSPALLDYLNADTTGLVTLALRFDETNEGLRIYAKEGGVVRAPRLELRKGDSWAGFPRNAAGWSDTGDWIGWVWSTDALDWVWLNSLQRWAYLLEEAATANGAWIWIIRD